MFNYEYLKSTVLVSNCSDGADKPDDQYIMSQVAALLEPLRNEVTESIKRQEELLVRIQSGEVEFFTIRNEMLGSEPPNRCEL